MVRKLDILEPTEVESDGIGLTDAALSDRDHLATGVDGIDAETPLDEQLRHFSRPAAHFENARARAEIAALDRSIEQ